MNREQRNMTRHQLAEQSRDDIQKAIEDIRLTGQFQKRGKFVETGKFKADKEARARRRFEQTGVYKTPFGKKRRVSKLKQSLKQSLKRSLKQSLKKLNKDIAFLLKCR